MIQLKQNNALQKEDWEKQIIYTLLEFDGDAKRGYFHEPRTEKKIIEIVRKTLSLFQEEAPYHNGWYHDHNGWPCYNNPCMLSV